MEKNELQSLLATHLNDSNQSELERVAREAVEAYPEDAFGYAYLAEAFLLLEVVPFDKVEICLAKSIELDKTNTAYMLRFAYVKEIQMEFEDMDMIYGMVLEADPTNADALSSLGLYNLRALANADFALDYFNRAIEGNPDNAALYGYRAEAYQSLDQVDAALSDVDKSLSMQFDETVAVLKISILKSLNRTSETEAIYKSLMEANPYSFTYPMDLGVDLFGAGRSAEAEGYLLQGLDLVPEEERGSAVFQRPLGEVYLANGKYTEALAIFAKCAAEDPEDVSIALLAVDAKIGAKDYIGAMTDVDKAIKLAKDDEFFADSMRVPKAEIYIAMGKYEEAKAIYAKLEKPLYEAEEQYGLGLIAHKGGNMQVAYQHLKNAKSLYPKAAQYIQAHFTDYLRDTLQNLINDNAAAFAKNEQSPMGQKLLQSVWQVQSIKIPYYEDAPEEVMQEVNQESRKYAAIFSKRAMLLSMGEDSICCFYTIDKEKEGLIQVNLLPIDGTTPLVSKLKMDADILTINLREGEFYRTKKNATAPDVVKNELRNQFAKEELSYMGADAEAILNTIF